MGSASLGDISQIFVEPPLPPPGKPGGADAVSSGAVVGSLVSWAPLSLGCGENRAASSRNSVQKNF